jgi:hypothetical protein
MADRVMADPDVGAVPSTRGEVWFRSHLSGRVLADLRWLGNQYQILVVRLPERAVEDELCCTEDLRLAWLRADRRVQEKFPHDCEAAECAPWIPYSEA